MPSGRWTIALDYSLASTAPGRDRWDVSTGWGYNTVHEATLAPTDAEIRTVQTDLDLNEPAQGIEIRSFLAGTGTIAIRGAEIARADVAESAACDR